MSFQVKRGEKVHKHPDLAAVETDLKCTGDHPTLFVTLRVNEEDSSSFFGTLRYRLKGIQVRLCVEGCSVKSINPQFDSEVTLYTERSFGFAFGMEQSLEAETSASISLDAHQTFEGNLANRMTEGKKSDQGRTMSLKVMQAHVAVGGRPDSLLISFEAAVPDSALRGRIAPEDWCTVALGPRFGRIRASIHVVSDDIMIRGVGGIWPKHVSENKMFLIRQLALNQLKYNPYIALDELLVYPKKELGGNEDTEVLDEYREMAVAGLDI